MGGILRDIFTMGARPIALLDSLRFGPVDEPGTRFLLGGVVAGISHYGNCFGCPTVGGEVAFAPEYARNPLVNVLCLGLVPTDRIFRARADGVGNTFVYVGAKTGRDGIHGATMASEVFDETSAERRPTVQVGDPFTEKLLLEACLEAFRTGAVVGIQDMGAAGLACSLVRDAGAGRDRRRRGPRPGAPARAGDDALRDPPVGVPGADAARRRARAARPRSSGSSRSGSWTRSRSAASRPTACSAPACGARWWPRSRSGP